MSAIEKILEKMYAVRKYVEIGQAPGYALDVCIDEARRLLAEEQAHKPPANADMVEELSYITVPAGGARDLLAIALHREMCLESKIIYPMTEQAIATAWASDGKNRGLWTDKADRVIKGIRERVKEILSRYTPVKASADEGLVDALEKLSRLGNGDEYGNSDGNRIAQEALARHKTSDKEAK